MNCKFSRSPAPLKNNNSDQSALVEFFSEKIKNQGNVLFTFWLTDGYNITS